MAKSEDIAEPDRFAGTPHPRDQFSFVGHEDGERAFIEGLASGRLHHAWLIGGAPGIGKATLAYRVARYLLAYGAVAPSPGQGFFVPADHQVSRQISAFSHPNFVVLRRMTAPDKKAPSATISVDSVRRAMGLFNSTSADGGYRICIVDSAEDLTISSANALLKLVEEPPSRSIFLIVSHVPQRLLPTIRSRCRKLSLSPLAENDIQGLIKGFGDPYASAGDDLVAMALRYGEGSVRKTLEMLDSSRATIIARVQNILQDLPRLDTRKVLALAETLSRREAEPEYELALESIERWISQKMHEHAARGAGSLAPLVEVCEKLQSAAREVDIYNLDRRPLILSFFDDLAQAVRRTSF